MDDENRIKSIKYEKVGKIKKIFIKFLDNLLVLILSSFLLGVIIYPIFLNLDPIKDKQNEISSYTDLMYEEALKSHLLSLNSNNELNSDEDIIYSEVRRSVKTILVDNEVSIKGETKNNYQVFESLSEENINYYVFNYRKNVLLLSDNFYLDSFNTYLSEYYELNPNYYSLKIEVANKLSKYIFEDEYTLDLKNYYEEYLNTYSLFYSYLINDFEANNTNYLGYLNFLETLINEYSFYILIIVFIAYILSYLTYFIIPKLIFKSDLSLVMKLFKIKEVNFKTNERNTIYNISLNLGINLILLSYLILFLSYLFFASYNLISLKIFNIKLFYYFLFLIVFNVLNDLCILINKNNMSLLDLNLNREEVYFDRYIKDE